MKYKNFIKNNKILIGVIIVIFCLLCMYVLISPQNLLFENKDTITSENKCLKSEENIIVKEAEISYMESWNIESGYKIMFNIENIPEGHKLKIKKNNNLIDNVYTKQNITYMSEVNDTFVITQYKNESNINKELIKIVIEDN